MTPAGISGAAVLVDTDIRLVARSRRGTNRGVREATGRARALHQLLTAAEIRTFLTMNILPEYGQAALAAALNDYTVLDVNLADVISEWSKLRSATARSTTPDHRERRQNDTWIAVGGAVSNAFSMSCARDPAFFVEIGALIYRNLLLLQREFVSRW